MFGFQDFYILIPKRSAYLQTPKPGLSFWYWSDVDWIADEK